MLTIPIAGILSMKHMDMLKGLLIVALLLSLKLLTLIVSFVGILSITASGFKR